MGDYHPLGAIRREPVGADRDYETMVFPALPPDMQSCCPWRIDPAAELALREYNDAADAVAGHMALCEEWSQKVKP